MDLPAPMLPIAGPLPTVGGWAFEFKWDGIRSVCGISGGRLRLQTRLGNDVSAKFPELGTIGAVIGDAVLDGELVILSSNVPDWGAVIRRRQARPAAVAALAESHPATVMVFDILHLGGEDLRARPYTERREILDGLDLPQGWEIPPSSEDGPTMTAVSRQFGLEGVVAKRLNSRYTSGRSRSWVKTRHKEVYDAVVIGWVRREDGGVTVLLAEATAAGLVYVGRCTAPRSIAELLAPLAAKVPPVEVPDAARAVRWVQPELPVEVTAASRTPDGRLRQPRFVRARADLG